MPADTKQYSSWGDYLKSYRTDHGSKSLSTLQQTQPAQRFCRTVPSLGSIADARHKHFCCGSDNPHAINADDGSLQRSQWHGWGDTSLLKQEGYEGVPHPRGEPLLLTSQPNTARGSSGCWATMRSCSDPSDDTAADAGADSWIGHPLIQPGKGKRAVSAPVDPRGRQGLGGVLAHEATGTPSDDAWCGHPLIVPSKGRRGGTIPTSCKGRGNLFAVIQQAAPDQTASISGRDDPYADAWIGNRQMAVGTGKKAIRTPSAGRNPLLGTGSSPDVDAVRNTGRKRVEEPGTGPARLGMAQTLRQEEPLPPEVVIPRTTPRGKRMLPERHPASAVNPAAADVYSAMTFRELDSTELDRYRHAWDDSGLVNRVKPCAKIPGKRQPGEADNLLASQPNRQGYFLRKGGLAQLHGVHPTPSTGGTGVLTTLLRVGSSGNLSKSLSTRPAWGTTGRNGTAAAHSTAKEGGQTKQRGNATS